MLVNTALNCLNQYRSCSFSYIFLNNISKSNFKWCFSVIIITIPAYVSFMPSCFGGNKERGMCAEQPQCVINYKRGLNPTCLSFFPVDFFKHIALCVLLDVIGCRRMFHHINGVHVRDEVDNFSSLRRHAFNRSLHQEKKVMDFHTLEIT